MSDTGELPVTDPTAVLPRRTTSLDVERERLKSRRATIRLITAALVTVTAVVAAIVVVIVTSRDTDRTNGDRIDTLSDQVDDLTAVVANLTTQLAAARDRIDANEADDDAIAQCERKLSANSRAGSRDVSIGMARLVIIITTTPIADRQAAAVAQVATLQQAVTRYDAATDEINEWQRLTISEQRTCPV